MNIFILDNDPVLAAQYHANKHLIKMILETAQLISAAIRLSAKNSNYLTYGYKTTHQNHPCSKWCRETRSNFIWLKKLGLALSDEYTYRYGKIHKSMPIIKYAPEEYIVDGPLTPFVQAMPDKYKHNDPVKAYRDYYIEAKSHLLVYTKRQVPIWLKGIATQK